MTQGKTLEHVLKEATDALIEDYARHIAMPLFIGKDGFAVYVLHSDMHFGNAIIFSDLSGVYSIDRNFYIQLHKPDIDFIKRIITLREGQGKQALSTIVNYLLDLEENASNGINKGFLKGLKRQILTYQIGSKIVLSGAKDNQFASLTKILQELELRKVIIPLRLRLVFKNIFSISSMLNEVKLGRFDEYVLKAEQLYGKP